MNHLRRWLAPPFFEGDEIKTHRVMILQVIILALICGITLVIAGIFLGGHTPLRTTIIDVLFAATLLYLYSLLRRGRVQTVGFSLMIAGYFFLVAAIASLGSIRTPTTAALIVLILIAETLFGFKGFLLSTGACSLAVMGLILAENAGWLPLPDLKVTTTQWTIYTVLYFTIGYLIYVTNNSLEQALERANAEIKVREVAENELRASEARFRSLFEQINDAVFLLDQEGNHLAANRRAADMLGYTLDEVQQTSLKKTSAELEQSQQVIQRLLAGAHIPPYERLFRKKDGTVFPVEINLERVRDKNGAFMHILSVVRDISQRKQAEAALTSANQQLHLRVVEVEQLQEELREQALHDPLTGLYNRRYLSEALQREILRAEREQTVLSVIVGDIDLFKLINDTYGHQAGDKFLVEIARLIKSCMRGSDLVCRYGGEEFLLVLPGTTPEIARQRAEEIRQKIAETTVFHEGKAIQASISLGVAAYPEHGKDGEEISIKADKALYMSKNSGRNRVTVWEEAASMPAASMPAADKPGYMTTGSVPV